MGGGTAEPLYENVAVKGAEDKPKPVRQMRRDKKAGFAKQYKVICEGTKNYYPEFKHTKSVESMTLSKEITGLYPGTKYTFVVVATTHCGKGDNSTMVTEHTIRDAITKF